MATSQYLPFGIGPGTPNTLSYATYAALTTMLATGFQPGIAKSEEVNTVLRQVTVGVAGVAKLIADHGSLDALDDGSVTNFKAALKNALDALYIQDLSGLVPTTAFTGGNQSKTTNGYQKLPGGLIVQWGEHTGSVGTGVLNSTAVTLPIAFPTACLNVSLTARNPTNEILNDSWPELVSKSTTTITVAGQCSGAGGAICILDGFLWFAIGH